MRVRLNRAMEMVFDSELTVREITETLGFESLSTFCRYFKKAYGMTTSEARSSASRNSRRAATTDWKHGSVVPQSRASFISRLDA